MKRLLELHVWEPLEFDNSMVTLLHDGLSLFQENETDGCPALQVEPAPEEPQAGATSPAPTGVIHSALATLTEPFSALPTLRKTTAKTVATTASDRREYRCLLITLQYSAPKPCRNAIHTPLCYKDPERARARFVSIAAWNVSIPPALPDGLLPG